MSGISHGVLRHTQYQIVNPRSIAKHFSGDVTTAEKIKAAGGQAVSLAAQEA